MIKQLLRKNMIVKYIYSKTILKYVKHKQNKLFLANGVETLFAIDKVFEELGIKYWLEFGTMLGAVRDKGFIAHDDDIDLACFFDDYHDENEKIFKKHGFEKSKEFLIDKGKFGREETYRLNGISIDIFYFHKRKDEIFCHLFVTKLGKGWSETVEEDGNFIVREISYPFTGFKEIDFYGKTFLIPSNVDDHLSASYGKNYMIKDPNYSNSIATNVKILKDKVGKGNFIWLIKK